MPGEVADDEVDVDDIDLAGSGGAFAKETPRTLPHGRLIESDERANETGESLGVRDGAFHVLGCAGTAAGQQFLKRFEVGRCHDARTQLLQSQIIGLSAHIVAHFRGVPLDVGTGPFKTEESESVRGR